MPIFKQARKATGLPAGHSTMLYIALQDRP
jgi:hypothetical protein